MNNKILSVALLLFTILFSCKRPPAKSLPPTPPSESSPEKVNVKNIDFAYFKSKSKVTYTDATASQNATVDVRIKKDSLIWLSINKVGIEGLRSLITRDSIFVIDRLNDDYQVYDFPSLSKKFNFPITFELLQAAIVGNVLLEEQLTTETNIDKEQGFYLLQQSQRSVTVTNYVSLNDLKLKRVSIVEKPANNSLNVQYENFNALDNFLFPYNSSVSLIYQSPQGNYNTTVTIEHTKAEILDRDIKFPFTVPQKYERKQ